MTSNIHGIGHFTRKLWNMPGTIMKVWTFAAAHGNYYNIHLCNFIREKGCDDFFALAFIFILPVTWSCGHIPLSILSSIRSTDVFCLAAAAQDPVYIVPLLSHSFSNTNGTPLPSLCTCCSPGSLCPCPYCALLHCHHRDQYFWITVVWLELDSAELLRTTATAVARGSHAIPRCFGPCLAACFLSCSRTSSMTYGTTSACPSSSMPPCLPWRRMILFHYRLRGPWSGNTKTASMVQSQRAWATAAAF
jgi:hypothetical protein